MKRKHLLLLVSPFLIIAVLTAIGVIIDSTTLIATCGLILFFICFWIFARANKLAEWLKSLQNTGLFQDKDWRQIFDFFRHISVKFALLIRAAFLSASKWTVDLYVSLCKGGIKTFAGQIEENLVVTVITMGLAAIDTVRGKSIEKPGFPTRIMTIYGAFQFFKNLILLISAFDMKFLYKIEKVFSNPLWFIESPLKYEMLRFVLELSSSGLLFIFILYGVGGLVIGCKLLFSSKSNSDAKNFGVALIGICCLVLTLPLFYIYVMIYGVPQP